MSTSEPPGPQQPGQQQPGQQHPSEPSRDERIQSPHDRLVNQTLQQIDAARALLANHLPAEITSHLKLDTLAAVDTSFIDLNLRRRFADRLFSIEVSDELVSSLGMRSNYVYLFVLVDHKSTDDPQTLTLVSESLEGLGAMIEDLQQQIAKRVR